MERVFTKRGESSAGEPPGNPSYRAWREIRERSIVEFVNSISKELGGLLDGALREQLYNVVFNNGLEPVRWRGASYDGRMLMDMYRRTRSDFRGGCS